MKATRQAFTLVASQSTAANYTSPAYSILDIDVQALQVNYTGSPSGTLAVQGSVDFAEDSFGNITNAGNWANLYFSVNGASPAASVAIPSNTSPVIFDMYGSGVSYIRLVYTGSGSGTITAIVTGKRLGD
jgi:hypothetical protein